MFCYEAKDNEKLKISRNRVFIRSEQGGLDLKRKKHSRENKVCRGQVVIIYFLSFFRFIMKRENEDHQDDDQHHDDDDTSDQKSVNKRSRKDEEEVRLLIPSKVRLKFFV